MREKNVALYCRVGSGGADEMRRNVLDAQRQNLQEYAREHGLRIVAYYEDNGFPGFDSDRPGLVRLLEDYRTGIFERVLVVNRSRLFRGSRWEEPRWPFEVCSMNQLERLEEYKKR